MPSGILGDKPVSITDTSLVLIRITIDPTYPAAYLSAFLAQDAVNNVSHQTYPFAGFQDDGFTENTAPNYVSTEIPGRDENYMTHMGSGNNREIEINFQFQAQESGTDDGGNGTSDGTYGTPHWVYSQGRWLDALKQRVAVDDGNGNYIGHAPPAVILEIGKLFAGRCILTSGSPHWRGPFCPGTLYPHGCEYSATFTVVRAPTGTTLGSVTADQAMNKFLTFPH